MGNGDKQPRLWLSKEILSTLEEDIKGKHKVEDEFFSDFSNGYNYNTTNYDVRIPISSADLPISVNREDLRQVWIPEQPLVPNDRIRRSSLWDSAIGLNNDLKIFNGDLEGEFNKEIGEDQIKEGKRAYTTANNIEATNELSNPSLQSNTNLDVESNRQSFIELNQASATPTNVCEIEKSHKDRSKIEMKNLIQKVDKRKNNRKNSMAERLSNLLKPRLPPTNDEEVKSNTFISKEISNDKENSQLNPLSLKKKSIAEQMPPEWVVLLLGCLLGLSSGISVVIFNKGVHFIHKLAWKGTPTEGSAWLRKQKLVDIWHRILTIPVVGGIIVGIFHSISDILDAIRASQFQSPLQGGRNSSKIDWLAALKQVIKAFQAALALGTGSSLGPEGPSVDIGKSWAHGFSNIMKNSKERRIALVAAGAAAGIASGFNAPVAGTFFAIETVLKPQHAENSPPLTTAMIILAAVISSAISGVLLGESPAFTVPPYELRSAAELPLYILLGGICGIMSIIFTRLVAWFTDAFEFLKHQLGVPPSVTPAIGAFLTGVIALQYPGVLYWGFTNVDEILKTGVTSTAPGKGLLTQLCIAKIVATAMCKGSGLVGGLYAPSLFIGSAAGGVYGSIVGEAINKVTPGGNAIAHPQAYALVGMAALLASMCSVPLTSVLLLFELTKDYHILLPLMGAVGFAIWVAALGKKSHIVKFINQQHLFRRALNALPCGRMWRYLKGGSDLSPSGSVWHLLSNTSDELPSGPVWRRVEGHSSEMELVTLGSDEDPNVVYIPDALLMNECKAADAMFKDFVRVNAMTTVKESLGAMLAGAQRCAMVVDENDLLEGIMSSSDLQQEVFRAVEESVYSDTPIIIETDTILVAAICTSNIDSGSNGQNVVVCYPDTSLKNVEEMMQSRGIIQLPVVTRFGRQWQERGHKVVGVLHRETILQSIKAEASKRMTLLLAQKAKDEDFSPVSEGGH